MKCPDCQGDGWTVEPDHAQGCDGNCDGDCPIPVQVWCIKCEGSGKIKDPTD